MDHSDSCFGVSADTRNLATSRPLITMYVVDRLWGAQSWMQSLDVHVGELDSGENQDQVASVMQAFGIP